MKRFLIIAAILVAIMAAAYAGLVWMVTKPAPPLKAGPIVQLAQGQIQSGIDRDNPEVLQINGIPFAAPPVGDLRWRPPEPALPWEDVRDGTEFGAECIQPRFESGAFLSDLLNGMGLNWVERHVASIALESAPPPIESEDCLFLNIRTANLGGADLQPVMVWIHGGGHQAGAGSMDIYQANQLVENGTILVTINYRLSVLGYIAHPALSADDPRGVSGNYGLLDQVAALAWVRDNITAFGGDPQNVTVFGESAGAQSVTELMSTPLSEGLFHKGILQSGSSSYNANGLTTAIDGRLTMHEAGLDFFDGLVSAEATAADLRALSATEVINHIPNKMHLADYALPTVDGVVIPKMMGQAIGDGSIHTVPILAGYNADEATLFYNDIQRPTVLVPDFPVALGERLDRLAEIYGEADAAALIALYGLDDPETYVAGETDMLGDDLFGVHMRYLAASNAAQGAPSYLYHFTRVPLSKRQTIGAFHAAELFFVLGSHSPLSQLSDEDNALTEAMGLYWTNFAKTGDPNGAGLPDWPRYEASTDLWMTFNPSIEVKAGIRKDKLDIMERALVASIDAAVPLITPEPDPVLLASSGQQDAANSLEP